MSDPSYWIDDMYTNGVAAQPVSINTSIHSWLDIRTIDCGLPTLDDSLVTVFVGACEVCLSSEPMLVGEPGGQSPRKVVEYVVFRAFLILIKIEHASEVVMLSEASGELCLAEPGITP